MAVPGLVKLVDRKEIEAADWSLTPGRYVGVAPPEVDEDFDFEQTLRDIHIELADLNKEAVDLAAKIQQELRGAGDDDSIVTTKRQTEDFRDNVSIRMAITDEQLQR